MVQRSRSSRAASLALAVCAAVVWASCQSTETPLPPTASHATYGKQLADVMRQLEKLDKQLPPQEYPTELDRQERIAKIAELALQVEMSADHIPDVLDSTDLPEELRTEFVGLAATLEYRAAQLVSAARNGTEADIRQRAEDLRASCTDCHTRFRVLPRNTADD